MLIVLVGVSFTEPLPSALWQRGGDMAWTSKTFWTVADCVAEMRRMRRTLEQAGFAPVHESCTEARVRAGTW